MTVRGAAKNPLPRPWPASIDTIAGIARLTTSSRRPRCVGCDGCDGAMGASGAMGATGAMGAIGAMGAEVRMRAPTGAQVATAATSTGAGWRVRRSRARPAAWPTGITCSAMSMPAAARPTTPEDDPGEHRRHAARGSLAPDAPHPSHPSHLSHLSHLTHPSRPVLRARSSTAARVEAIRHFPAAVGTCPGVLRRNESVGHKGVRGKG